MTGGWGGRRVLVTGATGIIGSWLVRRLLTDGAQVVVLIRDWDPQSELIRSGDVLQTTVVSGALEDYAAVERAICASEVDTVFHLGAQTIVTTAFRSPLATLEANIRGTYHVLEACRVHRDLVQRVVIASSDKAYGASKALPYVEGMPVNGRHPYDVSKSCADLLAMAYASSYGLPVGIARCGNVYGGGDLNWSRIVPGTIRSLLENRRPVLRSDGSMLRDYIYVKDVVRAYLALADGTIRGDVRGEAFNFGCEHPVSVIDITRRIQELVGRTDLEPVILDQARGEIAEQYLDCGRAKDLLGWSARYDLGEGLKETIDWYRGFLEAKA